jgi:hypothetical protein
MSDPRPDPDEDMVVKLPDASLDDLIADLEASWQGAPPAGPEQPAEVHSAPVAEPVAPPQRQERRGPERKEPHEIKV